MSHSENLNLKEPDILQYTNYRVFLRDYYDFKKKTSPAFSLRFFANKAGLSSHAHLKLAIDGKRNITKNTVVKLITGLQLDTKRAEYFECLVFFNQAKTDKERQIYYSQLLKCSPKSKLSLLEKTQFRIFKEWYHSVILEMLSLKDFKTSPQWISKKIIGNLSPNEIKESLHLLQDLDLLVKTANGYRPKEQFLTTDDEVQNILVKQYHQQMLNLAKSSLETLSASERDFSAVSFAIKRKDFPSLKKHIQLMRKELLDFSTEVGEADDVVQVNIQLFPLTRGV
ncbi:MAG: TIGR02147 family protein [Fibrobacter sp.]|mgnify:FL=1|jgi:uncharacterized protein (TIGR02147 family)|nr:TIGR02147 family protein [Fibrobacter sp.]